MISFKTFLAESLSYSPGNYICSYCETPFVPNELLPKTGKLLTDKHHITIIYSENSNVDQRVIQNVLSMVPDSFDLGYDCFSCFDSIPKEGERDENKATLVLKVKSKVASQLHDTMKMLGMQHSYPEFSPHVSICYEVDREEAYQCVYNLNTWLANQPQMTIQTKYFESKPIDKDWVKKL